MIKEVSVILISTVIGGVGWFGSTMLTKADHTAQVMVQIQTDVAGMEKDIEYIQKDLDELTREPSEEDIAVVLQH